MRRKEADMGRREDLWKKYLKKKEEVQKAVALLLREEESREIDRMRKDKDVEIWRKINRLFGKERKAKEIKIVEEGLVMEKERANRIMVEFWKSLYWREERKIGLQPSSDDDRKNKSVDKIKDLEDHNYAQESRPWNDYKEIDRGTVDRAMAQLKNGKAPGLSGITTEMWRAIYKGMGGEELASWFGRVKTGSIPKTWYRSKVLLIPKKGARC